MKIELVYADTKMPFKEHTKDEKSTLKSSPTSSTLSVSNRLGQAEGVPLPLRSLWMTNFWATNMLP
jgi:hypothetical protein